MSRQARTLLLLGIVAVFGLGALAVLAQRYRGIGGARPVATRQAGETRRVVPPMPDPAVARMGTPPGGPSAPSASGDTGSSTAAPETAENAGGTLRQVDRFIEVRRELKRTMEKRATVMKSMLAELAGTGGERTRTTLDTLFELRLTKERAMQAASLTPKDYDEVRTAYRGALAGKAPQDPSLAAALETRADALAQVSLGDYEPLDF